MWRVTMRDLQWRRRRVAIAIVGTALVFAMTLMIAGLAQGFRSEVDRTLAGVDADGWVVPAGSPGPFSAQATLPDSTVRTVAAEPGVAAAAPVAILRQTMRSPASADRVSDVIVLGVAPGGLGSPDPTSGAALAGPGQTVVDDSLGYAVGGDAVLGGRTLRVVGTTHGMTLTAGTPVVFVSLADAQAVGFGGQHVVTAVLVSGTPQKVAAGLALLDDAAVREDLLRPLGRAVHSLDLSAWLLWAVAATIVASAVYLSATERRRDFAVLKATGSSSASVVGGVALQAVLISVGAAVLAIVVAFALAPLFPLAVAAPLDAVLGLPAIAVVVGGLACLAGVRRVLTADPMIAMTSPA